LYLVCDKAVFDHPQVEVYTLALAAGPSQVEASEPAGPSSPCWISCPSLPYLLLKPMEGQLLNSQLLNWATCLGGQRTFSHSFGGILQG